MKSFSICFLALCAAAAGFKQRASSQTGSPVEKVVELLSELKGRMVEDGKAEKKVHDRTVCWCDKATHTKAKAIQASQLDIRSLGQDILKNKGKVATYSSNIDDLKKEIKKAEDAQQTAATIREKEAAEYMTATAETKKAMTGLAKAIKVLQGGTGGKDSLLQVDADAARATLRNLIEGLPSNVDVKEQQLVQLEEFAQGKTEYAPQSLTVLGILTDMYESFAAEVESATGEEADKSNKFEDFYASAADSLQQFKKDLAFNADKKTQVETALAVATQAYDDTSNQMKADIKFFDETKVYCKDKHQEWQERDHARREEMTGIEKAIEILTSDKARETFAGAIKEGKEVKTDDRDTGVDISFLQVSASTEASKAAMMSAYTALKAEAHRTKSLRMARLAAAVRLSKPGHFVEIIKQINEMMDILKEEGKEDTQKRDQCKDEYHKIDKKTGNIEWLIEKNEAKIETYEKLIEKRTGENQATIGDIASVEKDIDEMEKQRISENQDFLAAKEEDTNALTLLLDARKALSEYYEQHDMDVKGSLVQEKYEPSIEDRPDGKLSGKDTHQNEAKGIVSLMTMIIEDLNDEIKNGMKEEEQAQKDFVERLKVATDLKMELVDKRANLEDTISERTGQMAEERTRMKENQGELDNENKYLASIKTDCDWIIGAFDERRKKRAAEMDGLFNARTFLSSDKVASMQEESFIQEPENMPNTPKSLKTIGFMSLSPM